MTNYGFSRPVANKVNRLVADTTRHACIFLLSLFIFFFRVSRWRALVMRAENRREMYVKPAEKSR